MLKTHTLIIGGGLAGLSAAGALEGKTPYLLAERENNCGGLAATIKKGGFNFDYSGHLLHLRWPSTTKLILDALAGNCTRIKRDARVYACKKWTSYPFQANLAPLPARIKSECVSGFLKAYQSSRKPLPHSRVITAPEVFSRWTQRVFGGGISRYFMLPYNAKLWQYPLQRLTTEWCSPFVPMPDPVEVINGAYGDRNEGLGYNTFFYYPKLGGIGALPAALARNLAGLRLGLEVENLNITKGVADIRHFGPVHFKRLINTSPLNTLISRSQDAPSAVRQAAGKLRHNTVYVLNLGVKGAQTGMHWSYFPEASFPFYRAGIATNFSKLLAPSGYASFYVEIATDGSGLDLASAEAAVINGLKTAGLITSKRQIIERLWLKIPCAYVIYNRERAEALPVIFDWLKSKRALSIGRYGAWKYSFMEESMKEGLEAAREILREY